MRLGNIALREKVERLLEDTLGHTAAEKLSALIEQKNFTHSEFVPIDDTKHVLGAVLYNSQQILINADRDSRDRLFTLAHEVGHLILHPKKDYMDFRFKVLNPVQSDLESEANLFAYEFIMPFESFTKAYRDFEGDTYKIADFFLVTEARVSRRLSFFKKQISSGRIYDFINKNIL